MHHFGSLAWLSVLAVSLLGGISAQGPATTSAHGRNSIADPKKDSLTLIYSDLDSNGKFTLMAAYDVPPAVAMEAYAQDTNRHEPGGELFRVVHSGSAERIGTGQGFSDFLAANYEPLDPTALTGQNCGTDVVLLITFICQQDCPSPCPDYYEFSANVICDDDPPCPAGRYCLDHPERIVGIVPNHEPCACFVAVDPSGACLLRPNTTVDGLVLSGLLCQCAPSPTHS